MLQVNPLLAIDAYKLGHMAMHPAEIAKIYVNLTPRSTKYFDRVVPHESLKDGKIVAFGMQMAVQDIDDAFQTNFFSRPLTTVLPEFMQTVASFIGENAKAKEILTNSVTNLHNLGYLPLEYKALPEGTVIDAQIPTITCVSTIPGFGWLPNYLETFLSQNSWKTSTAATVARLYKRIFTKFGEATCDDLSHLVFQGHDFADRGMSGTQDAIKTGIAHATQFWGSDSVHASYSAVHQYGFENDLPLAFSVPATEHSVMQVSSTLSSEEETFRRLLKQYDTGIVSIVADTYDYWNTISVIAANLKEDILARQPDSMGLCKTVFRPDSGNPIDVICGDPQATPNSPEWKGSLEILWETFGGTINEKGYKVLNPKVGLIYGDSITPQRAHDILERMYIMGFASSNIVFGIGSYAYNYCTRDTLGYAVKATAAFTYDGKLIPIQKTVKTDAGKKSAYGLLHVTEDLKLIDNCTPEQEATGMLKTIYKDGVRYFDKDFAVIRERASK